MASQYCAIHAAKRDRKLADLPEVLKPYQDAVFVLVDSVYSDAAAPTIGNDRKNQQNKLNENFHKQEFQLLWNKINKKAVYLVEFETAELVEKCITAIDKELKVTPLQYVIKGGEQADELDYDDVQGGGGFELRQTQSALEHAPVPTGIRFDLVGKIATETHLTRRTVSVILSGINVAKFSFYKLNPEAFISDVARLITVMPAPNVRHEERQSSEEERSTLLESIGVATSAEARALLSKRRDLEASRKAVLTELKTLKVTGDPALVIAKTKSDLAEADAAISAALTDTKRQSLPSSKEIEDEKLELSQKRGPLDARRASLEETREQQQEALEGAVEIRSGTESTLKHIRKSIEDDVALCPDSERAARDASLVTDVTTAETTHQTAATVLSAKRQTTPDAAEIERREVRGQRLEQALENQKNDLIQLEREIGRLTGQIQTAGGDGVGETLAAAREQRALPGELDCGARLLRLSAQGLLRRVAGTLLATP